MFYSDGEMRNHPAGTLTIYARSGSYNYGRFSQEVREHFTVKNDSDMMTDYFEDDRIRVEPTHPLYAEVLAATQARKQHNSKMAERRASKRAT